MPVAEQWIFGNAVLGPEPRGRGATEPCAHDIDETYVCATRNRLVYDQGVELVFSLGAKANRVDFTFNAYNDTNSRRTGATNITEVIIYNMTLSKTS